MSKEYLASEKATIIDFGSNEYGLIYDNKLNIVEIWYNHNNNGSGCNNLKLDAFGVELDLEFCRSEKLF